MGRGQGLEDKEWSVRVGLVQKGRLGLDCGALWLGVCSPAFLSELTTASHRGAAWLREALTFWACL